MKILFENGKGKYYISLDRPDYSYYTDEREVLFQAGLRAQVIEVNEVNDGERVEFTLYISDKMISKEKKKRTLDYLYPVMIYMGQRTY